MNTNNPTFNYKYVLILILVTIIGLLCFTFYAKGNPIYRQLYNWNLVPKPEAFTELYFNNPTTLPIQAAKGTPIAFSFTIHNEEATSTVYPYVVYFKDQSGYETIFLSGSTTLAVNATATINVSHTFQSNNAHGMVIVKLTSLNQQIDFIL